IKKNPGTRRDTYVTRTRYGPAQKQPWPKTKPYFCRNHTQLSTQQRGTPRSQSLLDRSRHLLERSRRCLDSPPPPPATLGSDRPPHPHTRRQQSLLLTADATCNDMGGQESIKHLIKETQPNGGSISILIFFSFIFCINSILHDIFLFYFIYAHRIPE
uniref:Uncharacterized protein n=1 Tax=Triticum urartu TaxID=4572 RepID=A0A8R7TGH4_TRIUA